MSDNFSDLINNASMNYSDFIDDHVGNDEKIKQIPLAEIRPDPDQVRQKNNHGLYDFDDENSNQGNLKELVSSIKAIGVKQPIIVRPDPDNPDGSSEGPRYMIVIGERRYRACVKAGLPEIPAIVRNYDNVLEIQYDQISENIQRADLTTFEIAFFISKMRQSYLKINGKKLSNLELSKILGKPVTWISTMVAFSDCPEELLPYFRDGSISPSPRAGYNLITYWHRYPELTKQWFEDTLNTTGLIDIAATQDLIKFVKRKISGEENNAPQSSELKTQDLFQQTEPSEQEAEALENDSDVQASATTDDEYPVKDEKEHSAVPPAASAYSEDDQHTAGLGKPNYTDRDTRSVYDPADHLDEASTEDLSEAEPDEDNESSEASEDEEPAFVADSQEETAPEENVSPESKSKSSDINVQGTYTSDQGVQKECVIHLGKLDDPYKVLITVGGEDQIVLLKDLVFEKFI